MTSALAGWVSVSEVAEKLVETILFIRARPYFGHELASSSQGVPVRLIVRPSLTGTRGIGRTHPP